MDKNPDLEKLKTEMGLEIGDAVVIDHLTWKIAEFRESQITLYREGVDGTSHTRRLTVEALIQELQNQ